MANKVQLSPYERLLAKARGQASPLNAQYEITYRCNHRCDFCYNAPLKRKELDTAQAKEVIRKVADFGVLFLTLTGGEPLVRRDFFELGHHAVGLGLGIRIYTNGYLIDRTLAERISELHPFELEVSLHGDNAGSHDAVTRVPGSFDKLVAAFGHLKELGLRVNLKTPVTRMNQEELKGIRALADRFGFRVQFDLVMTPRDDGDTSPLQYGVSKKFLERYYSEEFARVRANDGNKLPQWGDNEVNCGTGRTGFMIDPYGNMFPCVQWRTRKFANILDIDSIGDVWHSSPVLHDVRRIAQEVTRTSLREVEYGKVCGFCPALAELQTGDATKLYDQARLRGEAIERAHHRWNGKNQATVR
jgi:radical SAM protein with 4Fe4S-binding SPASM domain